MRYQEQEFTMHISAWANGLITRGPTIDNYTGYEGFFFFVTANGSIEPSSPALHAIKWEVSGFLQTNQLKIHSLASVCHPNCSLNIPETVHPVRSASLWSRPRTESRSLRICVGLNFCPLLVMRWHSGEPDVIPRSKKTTGSSSSGCQANYHVHQ